MIVVRNVFVAKPGQASKLAALVKSAAAAGGLPDHRVLTDVTGGFNRVVLEYEVAGIAEFGEQMEDYRTNEALHAAMQGYTDLYLTGHRELLQTV